jgi:predicted nuclease with TOPRIM domain
MYGGVGSGSDVTLKDLMEEIKGLRMEIKSLNEKLEEQKKEFNERFSELEHQLNDQRRYINAFSVRPHSTKKSGIVITPGGISGPGYDPTGRYYRGIL